jgi:hypothetical protein
MVHVRGVRVASSRVFFNHITDCNQTFYTLFAVLFSILKHDVNFRGVCTFSSFDKMNEDRGALGLTRASCVMSRCHLLFLISIVTEGTRRAYFWIGAATEPPRKVPDFIFIIVILSTPRRSYLLSPQVCKRDGASLGHSSWHVRSCRRTSPALAQVASSCRLEPQAP